MEFIDAFLSDSDLRPTAAAVVKPKEFSFKLMSTILSQDHPEDLVEGVFFLLVQVDTVNDINCSSRNLKKIIRVNFCCHKKRNLNR